MTFLLIALLFFLAWRTTATGLRMRRKEHEAQQAQQARQALWAAGKQDVERQQQSKHGQRRTARKLQLELSGAASPSQRPRAGAAAPNPKQLAARSTEAEWQIAAAAAAAAGSSEPTAAAAAPGGADEPGTPLRVQAGAAALRSSPETPAAGQVRLGQPSPEQHAPGAAHDAASAAKRASQSGSLPMHVPHLPLTHPSTGSSHSLERSGGVAAPLSGRSLVPASPAPADLTAAASCPASSSRGAAGPEGSPASQAGTASSTGSASDGSTTGGSDSESGELPARQPSWLSAPLMLDGVLDPPSSRSSPGPPHWGLLASTDVATGERRSGRRARRQQRRQLQQRGQSGGSEAPGQSQPQPSEPAAEQMAQRAGGASQLDQRSDGALLAEGGGVLQVRMRAAWGARLLCPRWPRWRA